MKQRDIWDLQFKLDELSRISTDVQLMLAERPDLQERFGKMSEYARRMSSYVRTKEELPPVARAAQVLPIAHPKPKLLK